MYAVAYAAFAGFPRGLWSAYALVLVGCTLVWRNRMLYSDRSETLRDALTGCFGRLYAEFLIDEWLARGNLPFAVATVDLDGFKEVNDRYGHAAGDVVLVECSRIMASQLRVGDILARYGGDEFLIVLPGCDIAHAEAVCARVEDALQRTPVALRQAGQPVHVGAGIGVVQAIKGQTGAALVAEADAALYRAKTARGRVPAARRHG